MPDFRPQDFIEEQRARRLDRFSQFTIAATRMALADACLDPSREDPDRVGAMMGTALGGVAFAESQFGNYLREGPRGVDPALALTVFAGAASCNIAIEFGFTGPNSTNGMSCASGAIAIGEGFRAVRDGYADVMIAGGAEAPLAPLLRRLRDHPGDVHPQRRSRHGVPAVRRRARRLRDGRGRRRAGAGGARPRAGARRAGLRRGLGYGCTNDAHHMTAPRPDGRQAARAMRNALADGDVSPGEIGYINAHGSSTPLNDSTETLAIKQVFGEHAYRLALSGTKGYYGHALGASGAIEAAICALALARGWLPPTVNLTRPDPACDLDCLPREGRAARPDAILSNSFGFGGINAALVFRRAETPRFAPSLTPIISEESW